MVNDMEGAKVWQVLWYNVDWAEILAATMIATGVDDTPEQVAIRALYCWINDDEVELDPCEDEVSLLFKVLDPEGHETKVEIMVQRIWRFKAKRI